MTNYVVTCAKRDERGIIRSLGGTGWVGTRADIITWIESGAHAFTVAANGRQARVIVAGQGAEKYLRTDADSILTNNLDHLPQC